MINVFQLADNDQSIYYLGQIFGNVGFALSGTGPALLSELFKVFNTILLVIAVIIVTYVSVVGVIKTAAEGEVLGKGWSTLWVPLRTVFGIAFLMPTTTGYCAAQVLIMWFIVQGIGAADTVWSTAVKYFASGGTMMSAPPPSLTDVTGQSNVIWTKIVQNLICQSVVTKFSQNNENVTAHTQLQPYNKNLPVPINFYFGNASSSALGANSECGILTLPPDGLIIYQVSHNGQTLSASASANTPATVTFSDGKSVTVPASSYDSDVQVVQSSEGYSGRQAGLLTAYQTAFPTLEVISDYYVKQIIDDPNCWTNQSNGKDCTTTNSCNYFDKWMAMYNPSDKCFFGPTTGDESSKGATAWNAVLGMAGSNFLLDVTKLFTGEANNYAVAYVQANTQNQSGTSMSAVDDIYQTAQVNGWIYAGAYYYMLAGKGNDMQDSYTGFLNASEITLFDTKTAPDFAGLSPFAPQMQIMQYAPYLTKQASAALAASTGASGGGLLAANDSAGPSGALSASGHAIESMWRNAIAPSNGGNPLIKIQNFGHNLLLAADILCVTFFGISLIAGLLTPNYIALGFSVNYVGGAIAQGLSLLTTALFFLVAFMVSIGGLMGVYVPLIPYVLFSLGAIGWMIIVIEAMVAGPVIAIGLLSPGGQHEIFSKAEPAIMLTLSLMLRPTLMLFGMFAAMLLSSVIVTFINSAFFNVVTSFNKTGYSGMFETFLYIVAYVGLIITALNKCFELIYHVPDRVLHWIGHQGAGAGDAQALEAVKGKISAGGEAGGGAGKAVGGQAAGQLQVQGKKGDKSYLENKKANEPKIGGGGEGG